MTERQIVMLVPDDPDPEMLALAAEHGLLVIRDSEAFGAATKDVR